MYEKTSYIYAWFSSFYSIITSSIISKISFRAHKRAFIIHSFNATDYRKENYQPTCLKSETRTVIVFISLIDQACIFINLKIFRELKRKHYVVAFLKKTTRSISSHKKLVDKTYKDDFNLEVKWKINTDLKLQSSHLFLFLFYSVQ